MWCGEERRKLKNNNFDNNVVVIINFPSLPEKYNGSYIVTMVDKHVIISINISDILNDIHP